MKRLLGAIPPTGAGETVCIPAIDRGILEYAPFAVHVCDAAGSIILCNKKAREFWGKAPLFGAAIGRFFRLRTLSWPDGLPTRWETLIAETLRTGESASDLEVIFEGRGGEPLWTLVDISAFKSDGGEKILGAIICLQNVTARKQAEKSMAEALALSRTISETTPECIKIVSRDGALLYMNPAGLRMIEADAEGDLQGACVLDLIAPEYRDMWRVNNERVCDGERLRWEFDIIGLHGARRQMETHAAPFHAPGGGPASLAITRDITERKKNETELRAGEQRFRAVLDALPAAIYTSDASGRITFCNQAAIRFSGCKGEPDASQRRECPHRLISEGAMTVGSGCPVVLPPHENRAAGATDAVVRRADGECVSVVSYPSALYDASGALTGEVNMLVDVTEHKRAEQQRIEGEQMARAVIDTALDAFIQMDEAGRVIEWNAQAETLFGWSRQEATGRDLSDLIVPPNAREPHRAGLERFVRTGTGPILGKRCQIAAQRRDGSTFAVELTVTSIRRHEGYLFNAFIRDITEKLAAESRLQQATKMEVMGQLTGGVAHDFNNLLMVISAGIDMIERHEDRSRRRVLLEGMRRATERGANLTRQLLTFSRRQAMQPEVIDLGAHVGKSRELLDRSLGDSVHVVLDIAPGLWPIEVDPSELEIAVLNLAVNARDAMPNGGEIVIRARNVDAQWAADLDIDCVRLDMIDTGVGMCAEVQARVFEPFFTTKNIGKGSGLGLAQVYGFAQQSGGTVQIESTLGRGSTISLFLPRSLKEPEAELLSDETDEEQKRAVRGNVLLVEDDEQVAELVTEMLDLLGYRVTRAANANAALGALSSGREVDLVFSDVMMPGGMNGVELAREVKRRRPGMPVVLTSGYADAVKRDADAEGVLLLAKPYRLETFAEVIREALENAPKATP